MIQFQKGYTTLEQSKKLLGLGVPIDSANMVYLDTYPVPKMFLCTYSEYCENDNEYQSQCDYPKFHKFTPCWSVGRLMEIFDICSTEINTTWLPYNELDEDYITYIIHLYEQGELDFSKLDE